MTTPASRIKQVRSRFLLLCKKLGVTRSFYTAPQHDGSAHVEVVEDSYHYVTTERGIEFERRTTASQEELLYFLLSDVVFEVASEFELSHRVPGQSFRRLLFAKEIELMDQLDLAWGKRKTQEIEERLQKYPYDDALEG